MFGDLKIGLKMVSKSKELFKKTHTNSAAGIRGIPKQRQSYSTALDPMIASVSVWHGKWWTKDLQISMFLKADGLNGSMLNIQPNRNKTDAQPV
jgi:hypothetical protein